MKHRIVLVVLLVAMTVGLESCGIGPRGCCCAGGPEWSTAEKIRGSGRIVRVNRVVGDIDAVRLATIGTLHIEFGEREELIIEGEDNIIEHIETDVEHGTLKIANERRYNLRPTEPVDYYLTVEKLEGIALSSAGDAYAPDIEASRFWISVSSSGELETGRIATGQLEVSISSSGDVSIPYLESKSLEASLSSSGGLVIEGGTVVEQDIRLSSSGSYRARDLESDRADVRVSSSGSAYVLVTEDLNARMSSSGSVYYSGNPRVKQRTSSSGRLMRLDV
jgi:hypothetical protein